MKELNKANLNGKKWKKETIKKSKRETILEIENQEKRQENITNKRQEIVERISGAENTLENTDTTVKGNSKCKIPLKQNIQEFQDTMRRPNQRIIGIKESEDSQLNRPLISSTELSKKKLP